MFIVKKKKKASKWRMVTDLRAGNKVIQPMGPLHSGIPLPSLLPKGWSLIVIDLKDCFFTIPLQKRIEKNSPSQCLFIIMLSLLRDTSGLSSHRVCLIAEPCVNTL